MKLTLNKDIGSVHVELEVSAEDEPHVEGLAKLVYRCVEATEILIAKLNEEFFDDWARNPDNKSIYDTLQRMREDQEP